MSTTSDLSSILLQRTCDANYEVNNGELVGLSVLYVCESMLHCFHIDSVSYILNLDCSCMLL